VGTSAFIAAALANNFKPNDAASLKFRRPQPVGWLRTPEARGGLPRAGGFCCALPAKGTTGKMPECSEVQSACSSRSAADAVTRQMRSTADRLTVPVERPQV